MPEQLYDRVEYESALTALKEIVARLPEPFVLIGGWAVYVTVNESFADEHGASYLGSRDIDVCFQVDPECSESDLRTCTFSKAIAVIQNIGYSPDGSFRYCKIIKRDTGEAVTKEVAQKIGMYDLFYLYIDVMVDNIHPKQKDVFGFNVLEEPVIRGVFNESTGVVIIFDEVELLIPPPVMLLATKLVSIQNRTKDDKLTKDACDIYAILWHSSISYQKILEEIHHQYPQECRAGFEAITDEVSGKAARHLGIEAETYRGVIRGLIENL
ncbi:MAG: hypothetical protein WC015_05845 [Methanoregula sp.]